MTTGTAALGLAFGLGVWLVIAWVLARRPSLEARMAPHVRGAYKDELARRYAPVTPFPTLERLLGPALKDAVGWVERWGSSSADVRARLARAGLRMEVEQFRAEQVLWAVAGLAAGTVLSVGLAATRGAPIASLVVLTACSAAGGAALRDYWLSRAIAERESRILAELPTVAELLALAVSAGEGALGAIERVTRGTHGALAEELSLTLASTRAGAPLPVALGELAARSQLAPLRRFADGIATAVERGTPLAAVLQAQAQDVRSAGQRALMEEGGKREIAMMVPVVFLILPVTVLFAVFPGLATIRLGL